MPICYVGFSLNTLYHLFCFGPSLFTPKIFDFRGPRLTPVPTILTTYVTIKKNCHPERVKRVELFLSGSPKIGDFWGYKEKREPLGEAGSRLVRRLQFDCLFASPYLKEIPFWVSPKTHFLRKMFDFGKQF